ncbi:hypothetical protein J4427_01675 [Candidatus Woesearchaeota archaeon]|nr:hypothetical protein [Candidatus Woesearchaeota archaeon]
MKTLIKVSGDLIANIEVIEKIKELAKSSQITLIHGAGTSISNALDKAGIPYEFKNGIRNTCDEGLKICLDESCKIRTTIEKMLEGYDVEIISPCINNDGKIINSNAEEIFRNIHEDFDEKIIFTISDREKPLIGRIKDIKIIKM